MKISRLRKVAGIWKGMFLMGNVCKMRKVLARYLDEEGMMSRIKDGQVIFDFDGCTFNTDFDIKDGYAECCIRYAHSNKDFDSLDAEDRNFIAAKANTDLQNHCKALPFKDCIRLESSFYFSNKQMMLDLFRAHFREMTESLTIVMKAKTRKMVNRVVKSRRIGFYIDTDSNPEQEVETVVAKVL